MPDTDLETPNPQPGDSSAGLPNILEYVSSTNISTLSSEELKTWIETHNERINTLPIDARIQCIEAILKCVDALALNITEPVQIDIMNNLTNLMEATDLSESFKKKYLHQERYEIFMMSGPGTENRATHALKELLLYCTQPESEPELIYNDNTHEVTLSVTRILAAATSSYRQTTSLSLLLCEASLAQLEFTPDEFARLDLTFPWKKSYKRLFASENLNTLYNGVWEMLCKNGFTSDRSTPEIIDGIKQSLPSLFPKRILQALDDYCAEGYLTINSLLRGFPLTENSGESRLTMAHVLNTIFVSLFLQRVQGILLTHHKSRVNADHTLTRMSKDVPAEAFRANSPTSATRHGHVPSSIDSPNQIWIECPSHLCVNLDPIEEMIKDCDASGEREVIIAPQTGFIKASDDKYYCVRDDINHDGHGYYLYLHLRNLQDYFNKPERVAANDNHGLAHSTRQAFYVPSVLLYFQHTACNEYRSVFANMGAQIKKMQLAMLFYSVGRKDESSFSANPNQYIEFRKDSADLFKSYALEMADEFRNLPEAMRLEQIELYAEVIYHGCEPTYIELLNSEYRVETSKPESKLTSNRISQLKQKIALYWVLNLAHKIDLLRCYTADEVIDSTKYLKDIISDMKPLHHLYALAFGLLEMTGDNRLCSPCPTYDPNNPGPMLTNCFIDANDVVFQRFNNDPYLLIKKLHGEGQDLCDAINAAIERSAEVADVAYLVNRLPKENLRELINVNRHTTRILRVLSRLAKPEKCTSYYLYQLRVQLKLTLHDTLELLWSSDDIHSPEYTLLYLLTRKPQERIVLPVTEPDLNERLYDLLHLVEFDASDMSQYMQTLARSIELANTTRLNTHLLKNTDMYSGSDEINNLRKFIGDHLCANPHRITAMVNHAFQSFDNPMIQKAFLSIFRLILKLSGEEYTAVKKILIQSCLNRSIALTLRTLYVAEPGIDELSKPRFDISKLCETNLIEIIRGRFNTTTENLPASNDFESAQIASEIIYFLRCNNILSADRQLTDGTIVDNLISELIIHQGNTYIHSTYNLILIKLIRHSSAIGSDIVSELKKQLSTPENSHRASSISFSLLTLGIIGKIPVSMFTTLSPFFDVEISRIVELVVENDNENEHENENISIIRWIALKKLIITITEYPKQNHPEFDDSEKKELTHRLIESNFFIGMKIGEHFDSELTFYHNITTEMSERGTLIPALNRFFSKKKFLIEISDLIIFSLPPQIQEDLFISRFEGAGISRSEIVSTIIISDIDPSPYLRRMNQRVQNVICEEAMNFLRTPSSKSLGFGSNPLKLIIECVNPSTPRGTLSFTDSDLHSLARILSKPEVDPNRTATLLNRIDETQRARLQDYLTHEFRLDQLSRAYDLRVLRAEQLRTTETNKPITQPDVLPLKTFDKATLPKSIIKPAILTVAGGVLLSVATALALTATSHMLAITVPVLMAVLALLLVAVAFCPNITKMPNFLKTYSFFTPPPVIVNADNIEANPASPK